MTYTSPRGVSEIDVVTASIPERKNFSPSRRRQELVLLSSRRGLPFGSDRIPATLPGSSKGQVTLPARLRRKPGIKPHDRVVIETTEDAILIRKASDVFELEGFLGKALPRDEETKRTAAGIARRVAGGKA